MGFESEWKFVYKRERTKTYKCDSVPTSQHLEGSYQVVTLSLQSYTYTWESEGGVW